MFKGSESPVSKPGSVATINIVRQDMQIGASVAVFKTGNRYLHTHRAGDAEPGVIVAPRDIIIWPMVSDRILPLPMLTSCRRKAC